MKIWTIHLRRLYLPLVALGLAAWLALCCLLSAVAVVGRQADPLLALTDAGVSRVIILDAGHGGEDCGAVGVTGVYEKDLNLALTFRIGEELTERGYTVVYTRTEDRLLYREEENIKGIRKISDLKNRCAVAEEYPDALFLSVHMNSYSDSRASGLQVYYSAANAGSRLLAQSIQGTVRERLQENNRRAIKEGKDIYVLTHIQNPAVLVECGFITNGEECARLCEKDYQKQLSFAIVCGIMEYMETKSA